MKDSYGRTIDYARISITDRCNLRCRYCMPEEGVEKRPHADILSYEEILRVCGALARAGIRKIRLTGGEPLLRRDMTGLVGRIAALTGIEEVTLTTNGQRLAGMARGLKQAGLAGVNISLDTMNPREYRQITRGGSLEKALEGLHAAREAGLAVKVNCVPVRVLNDAFEEVALLARDDMVHVRFIELMPIGPAAGLSPVGGAEIRRRLEERYGEMTAFGEALGNGPAAYGSLPGFTGKIGLIHPLTRCFCERCNRLRLTAEGRLIPCLYLADGVDLRGALSRPDNLALAQAVSAAIAAKPRRHKFIERTPAAVRAMFRVGG